MTLTIYKAGWIIGGSGGSGVLNFRGRSYALSTGGLDYGLVFGGSRTVLRGRVSNIFRPSDVAGVYGAAGAGLAVGAGARAIVLTNQKGAVLEALRHAGRPDGECGPQRPRDHDAVERLGCRVGKGAQAPCPPYFHDCDRRGGTLRFAAHPTAP